MHPHLITEIWKPFTLIIDITDCVNGGHLILFSFLHSDISTRRWRHLGLKNTDSVQDWY